VAEGSAGYDCHGRCLSLPPPPSLSLCLSLSVCLSLSISGCSSLGKRVAKTHPLGHTHTHTHTYTHTHTRARATHVRDRLLQNSHSFFVVVADILKSITAEKNNYVTFKQTAPTAQKFKGPFPTVGSKTGRVFASVNETLR